MGFENTRREMLRMTAAAAGAGSLGLGAIGVGSSQSQSAVLNIGEVKTVRSAQAGPGEWHTEELRGIYLTKPIVIMKPVSRRGDHPCHIRLRNVTRHSFQYQIEEWDYLDGGHTTERFFYIAVEPGLYTLSGIATGIEAGRVSANTASQSVDFLATYGQNPVVLTQSQTQNGPDAIVTRTEVSSGNSFGVQLQEEEGSDGGRQTKYHENETVGYLAFERPASGVLDPVLTDFEVGLTPKAVTNEFYRVSFSNSYRGTPRFIADLQTKNGPDTTGLRYHNLNRNGVDIRAEEEKSLDNETTHTAERVGYVVIGKNGLIPGISIGL